MHIQEQEDNDYEEGCQHTAWLIAKFENLQMARGEEGWSDEDEAEYEAVRRRIYGE